MSELIQRIEELGIIPVIKIDRAEDACPLAEALKAGGLCCAEITFRTDAAKEAIRRISEGYPDFLIIAGTVLSPEQVDTAVAAGAAAVVSPGFNPAVVKHCIDKGVPVIPGVCTPSEVEQALAFGLSHLKFFPAEAAGGVAMIKAMAAPYTKVRFMPTGGINAKNLAEYIACESVFACGGSWMVPADEIAKGNFEKIKQLTAEAASLLKEIRNV